MNEYSDPNATARYHYELDSERLPGFLPDRPGVYLFKEKTGSLSESSS